MSETEKDVEYHDIIAKQSLTTDNPATIRLLKTKDERNIKNQDSKCKRVLSAIISDYIVLINQFYENSNFIKVPHLNSLANSYTSATQEATRAINNPNTSYTFINCTNALENRTTEYLQNSLKLHTHKITFKEIFRRFKYDHIRLELLNNYCSETDKFYLIDHKFYFSGHKIKQKLIEHFDTELGLVHFNSLIRISNQVNKWTKVMLLMVRFHMILMILDEVYKILQQDNYRDLENYYDFITNSIIQLKLIIPFSLD